MSFILLAICFLIRNLEKEIGCQLQLDSGLTNLSLIGIEHDLPGKGIPGVKGSEKILESAFGSFNCTTDQ